jgi:hypothetical protein
MRHMAYPVAHKNEIVGASVRSPHDIAIFEAVGVKKDCQKSGMRPLEARFSCGYFPDQAFPRSDPAIQLILVVP